MIEESGSSPTPNPPPPQPISGIILVDKPASGKVTSMTAVCAIKRRLRASAQPKSIKVGHAGTLDPLASGLLIVLVGKATKLCERLMADRKEYVAGIDLSKWSATDDLERSAEPNPEPSEIPTREKLERVLAEQFTGVIQQRPPDYSAMLIGGKRAYDLARAGKAIDLQPRPVIIHEVRIVEYSWPNLVIDVRCGKGTYIRSMARDIGIALTGSPGVMTSLRRTSIGVYRVEHATPLDKFPETLTQADLIPTPQEPLPADHPPSI